MIFTGLTEPFFVHVKVAFFFALLVSCPVVLTQIWIFIAPGLYRNERSATLPFLVASPILFFLGRVCRVEVGASCGLAVLSAV